MRFYLNVELALILAALVPAGLAAGGDAKAGKAVYAKRCASCHGPNGEGNEKMAKMLKVEIRDLGSKEVQAKSDEQLCKETVEGVGKMKPVKGLSDKDVADLVGFMRSLAKK